MEAINKKISKLEEQRIKIEQEIAALNQKRNESLIDFIRTLPPTNIEPSALIGGLLFVVEEAQKNPATAERWRHAGANFLKRKSGKPKTAARSKKVEQQAPKIVQSATPTAGKNHVHNTASV